jgi:hypothetical protein
MKQFSWILLIPLACLLSACASVKSTAVFYQPTTSKFYPPKDKHAVIPILSAPPVQPYTEIGRFAFQSDLGYPFMMKAVEYNARQAGADAVYIKESKSWNVPYAYTVPTTVSWVPVGGYYGGGCGGWYGGAVVPITYPGYTGVSYQSYIGMDARMIVFKQ